MKGAASDLEINRDKIQRIHLGQKEDRKEEKSHRSLVEQAGSGFLAGEIKWQKEEKGTPQNCHPANNNHLHLFTFF